MSWRSAATAKFSIRVSLHYPCKSIPVHLVSLAQRHSMAKKTRERVHELVPLQKAPTGIWGLDEITLGGLPQGRTTIVCGGPGCGKTMLGIEFLVRGALEVDEPGVLMAFEETPEDIAKNVASLGFDIDDLAAKKQLFLDYISVEPSEIAE